MQAIEAAILRTLLYADVFRFAMTPPEIHRYLIHNQSVSISSIEQTLAQSAALRDILHQKQGYICLADHKDYIAARIERETITTELWETAIRYGKWLGRLPYVRMVTITGALAVRNPADIHDDFDYLLVTKKGRVWLARAFAILLVRLVRLRGHELCPNYILAEHQLTQKRQDIFTAHEVAQMVPVYDRNIYLAMMAANDWVSDYLPNATPYATQEIGKNRLKSVLEWALGGRIGDWFEQWEYRRKLRKFSPMVTQENSDAQIDDEQVKGHFEDRGNPALEQYYQRLEKYGLVELAMAGD